jgi:D-alanyl-D-alanine carboxypeptidase
MKRYCIRFLLLLIIVMSCTACTTSAQGFDAESASGQLDAILNDFVRDANGEVYRNAAIQITMPGYTHTGAAGVARDDTGEPMTVDHQFVIASVGKPMTAVVIYQLWEEGKLGPNGLDATLAELGVFPPEVIEELHQIDGVSYGNQITVRHLLTQTSGLKDVLYDDAGGLGDDYGLPMGYAPDSLNGMVVFDEEHGFSAMMDCVEKGIPAGCSPDDYYLSKKWPQWDYKAWAADPSDRMAGLINFYLAGANETALWKPGEAFHYADTNYMLLGLVIEHLTGNSLHHELRKRIFDPLGMDHTYLNYADDPPAKNYAYRLADEWGGGKPLISRGVNLSSDWGGGGEISTVGDLTIFMRALANGKLFKNESTLAEMLVVPEANTEAPYASGLLVHPVGNGLVLHHNGSNGTWIEYHTAYDLTVVGTIDDIDQAMHMHILREQIYDVLAKNGLAHAPIKGMVRGLRTMTLVSGLSSPLLLIVFGVSALVLLISGIIWVVASIRARRSDNPSPEIMRWARLVGIITVSASIIFVVVYVMVVMGNPIQLMLGLSPVAYALGFVPYVLIILTVTMVVLSAIWWIQGQGKPGGRIHYSVAVAAMVTFIRALSLIGMF